jgi:hypothetical protein
MAELVEYLHALPLLQAFQAVVALGSGQTLKFNRQPVQALRVMAIGLAQGI